MSDHVPSIKRALGLIPKTKTTRQTNKRLQETLTRGLSRLLQVKEKHTKFPARAHFMPFEYCLMSERILLNNASRVHLAKVHTFIETCGQY